VKNVDLIEVSQEELGNSAPAAGTEIVLRGVRYRVVNATPPRVRSSRWKSKRPGTHQQTWKLLVESVDGGAASGKKNDQG
jgi:hypothetical protein